MSEKNLLNKKDSEKYYTSIKEMPMYNWISIFEYYDLKFLLKKGDLCEKAGYVYQKLQDELVDEFGISEDFLQILRNKLKIESYLADQIITGNKSNQIFIEMLEIDNEEATVKDTKFDLFDSIIPIEKYMGFKFDPKKITVFEFHKYSRFVSNKLKHHN